MKRNSRKSSETIERMLLSREITRLRSDDQYLRQYCSSKNAEEKQLSVKNMGKRLKHDTIVHHLMM